MINKKTAALSIVIGALLGTQLSKIYVKEGFENPLLYKLHFSLISLVGGISTLAASYNYGNESSNIRAITDTLVKLVPARSIHINNIQITDDVIKGIKVRIYKPKEKSESKRPGLVYYHGGGYVFGSVASYDLLLAEIVDRLNMVAISVDYRMAPNFAFPTPTNDCYEVTQYVFNNAKEFNIDVDKIVLAGDSAGGNAVAVITQRILKEKKKSPKLQVLIYPWLQMWNNRLPSASNYKTSGYLTGLGVSLAKYSLWYLGHTDLNQDLVDAIKWNNHTALIENEDERNKIISYLDLSLIPDEYKKGNSYYDDYEQQKKFVYPTKIDKSSVLRKDKNIANLLKKLYQPEISPLFADANNLAGLPKAYIQVCEWDTLKDEALMYATRLRNVNVPVEIGFYENAFHAVIALTQDLIGFNVGRTMIKDIVNFIQKNINS